jgi:hypothetical protein
MNIEEVLSSLEEVSQAIVAAAGRGDLDVAATLVARRATLIRALGPLSDGAFRPRLELIRSAGDRATAMLRAQRACDLMCVERIRQVAATSAVPPSNTTVVCVG